MNELDFFQEEDISVRIAFELPNDRWVEEAVDCLRVVSLSKDSSIRETDLHVGVKLVPPGLPLLSDLVREGDRLLVGELVVAEMLEVSIDLIPIRSLTFNIKGDPSTLLLVEEEHAVIFRF